MEVAGKIELLNHRDDDVAAEIHAVFQDSYRAESKLIGITDFPPLRRSSRDIKLSNTLFWGRIDLGGLSGVIEVEQEDSLLHISSLAIVPRLFRQGIGASLVSYVLSARDWQQAEVQTATANAPAIGLYRNLGFSEKKYWSSNEGIELVLLRKCNRR